ncbi:MAG: formate dehydrogenase subunit alpha [Gammaproteobacteria bacterium]|nr:formate dehydrogenase subunit alpha [Gammaproteobacteria bacterium]
MAETVRFTLDGHELDARRDETILQAAARHGVAIPHLCHKEGMEPAGNCRACMVEIDGERALAASCCRRPDEGMNVAAASSRARHAQRLVLELLAADVPDGGRIRDDELRRWCDALEVGTSRFPARPDPVPADASHPAITVRLDACIHCTRCLRACRDVQGNDVIGFAARGAHSRIVFDQGTALGPSSCVACGECVQACPTGALAPAHGLGTAAPERSVASVCPYCGVGCQLTFHVRDERIVEVEGRDGPANRGRLCVKGRYGFDYVHHPHRLTRPLIRREDAPKAADLAVDPADPSAVFREASWDEALDAAASGLLGLLERHGPGALAGFGSAKGSNEEAYLFQKLVRTGFGSNHVDHCTRLCHASSVAALLQMIGSGAVSNPVADVAETDVILVIGSNTTVNHPVAATFMKNAARNGKTLILLDPRRTPLARHAQLFVPFRPDTDVALLNALLHVIVEEELYDRAFVERRTTGFEALAAHVRDFSPEKMVPLCGVPAETLREVARRYATADAAMIFWGMGISQHVHGTDNARALINLALVTGQIGRPGTGLHPLRGQNNVQGASDAGLIPMVFPDYRRVDDPAARADFETLWNTTLDPEPGLTVVEIVQAILAGTVRGMYILGENPAMSDPDLGHAREALAKLEHLVVQDIFLTETAYHADVVLPASAFPEKSGTFTNTDRRVQLGRKALSPPGEARQDLWILQQLARRLGLDWNYHGPDEVFAEMTRAMPSIAGIDWTRLEREGAVTYPCPTPDDPGRPVIFTDTFPTADGRARLVPAPLRTAEPLPDAGHPYVLITGRLLEHWHTGAMTRRATTLDALEPRAEVGVHPDDMARLGIADGAQLRLRSRQGQLVAAARSDASLQPGQLFLPFCYAEAAANQLTSAALDPDAKIPGFKFTAVAAEPA